MSTVASRPLESDLRTTKKLALNLRRNRAQSQGESLDTLAAEFDYDACKSAPWNPPELSLMWGTPLWDQASESQRLVLNHLFWVAYYSQIISAEIATIFFNQTAAAGLYTIEDFRIVCDSLDLESSQERSHIAAFKTVAEATEDALFGRRLFTYPMRSLYVETMIFRNANWAKRLWRRLQLQAFVLLSSGNAFMASQYLTVRGMRTLNGKLVQHKLSTWTQSLPDPDVAPIPARISHLHFLDESFHFNTSTIVGTEVVNSLKPPTAFERMAANMGIRGCQKDHYDVSQIINGIFWYDPAAYQTMYDVLRSPVFGMDDGGARQMLAACFGKENEGLHAAFKTHEIAADSYRAYVEPLSFIAEKNKAMSIMKSNTVERYLRSNRRALKRFGAPV